MKKFLPILLLLCSACASTHQKESASRNDAMNDVAIYALSLADTPYQFGGNSPENGFDCSGFVRYVFQKSLGHPLPRTSQEMSQAGEPLEADQLRPGDLVFFNTQRQPFSHVGIYLGEDRFVHSPSSGKAIAIVNMRENYWQSRYNGARRIQQSH
jgi:cell wall-associated NlpC family hydrolase